MWDVETGKEIRRFEGHTDWVWDVSIARDGKRLLSASSDKTVRLWDLASGKELKVYEGHTDYVRSARFSPDGRWAISASHDHTLKLWALPLPAAP
jgi:WD40 repeat protein